MAWTRRGTLAAAASMAAIGARAQGPAVSPWPEKPVRIIVPFPPGQAADIFTRLYADELSRRWPHRVVVENRGGGAGAPALEAGARAAPDGYTLTAGTSGTLGVNPSVLPRLPYDAEKDFAFIPQRRRAAAADRGPSRASPSARRRRSSRRQGQARRHRPRHRRACDQPAHVGRAVCPSHRHEIQHGALPRQRTCHGRPAGRQRDADVRQRRLRPRQIQAGKIIPIAVTTPDRAPQLPDCADHRRDGGARLRRLWLDRPLRPRPVCRTRSPARSMPTSTPSCGSRRCRPASSSWAAPPPPARRRNSAAFVRREIAQWREVARIANVRLEG